MMSRRSEEGRHTAIWEREFKLPWREAGPPNYLDDKREAGPPNHLDDIGPVGCQRRTLSLAGCG